MTQDWKDIDGYNGLYQVNRLGIVRSLDRYINFERKNDGMITRKLTGKVLKPGTIEGYEYVNLTKNGIRKTYPIHRLVAKAFIPNPLAKPSVNHIDNNRTNNNVKNIEWCTPMENSAHAKKQNRCWSPRGDNHARTRIKEKEIPVIRKMIQDGFKITEIAKLYKVSQPTISDIKSGKTYSHVK